MELEAIGLNQREITKLNKKGFYSVEDVQEFYPRKYYDYSKVTTLMPLVSGNNIAGICKKWLVNDFQPLFVCANFGC